MGKPKDTQAPDFGGWNEGFKEVKTSVLQAVLRFLAQSGIRGFAVLSAVVGLVWVAGQTISSPMDGAFKAICVLGIGAALLCVALVALLTEKTTSATAKQQSGRVSSTKSRNQPGHKAAPRPPATGNGS